MRKIIGYSILASMFIGLMLIISIVIGIIPALIIFTAVMVLTGLTGLAVHLIEDR